MNMADTLNRNPARGEDDEEIKTSKVLEINPNHDLFKSLISNIDSNDDEKMKEYGSLLYDEALLLEGQELKDKEAFITRINSLLLSK